MSSNPWHRRYHSDALAGFMSLTLEQRGAYQTLLDLMYDRGGPLVDNERLIAGYMGCSTRKWQSLREALVAAGKIVIDEQGMIANPRVVHELEKAAKTSRKHAENGSKGGRARVDNAEKYNDYNDSGQAELKRGSSIYQKPDTRSLPIGKPHARDERAPVRSNHDDLERKARELAQVVGLTRPITAVDRDQLRSWLADGLDFELHVIEAARPIAAREHGRGRAISGFRYLDGAVRQYGQEWRDEHDRLRLIVGGRA